MRQQYANLCSASASIIPNTCLPSLHIKKKQFTNGVTSALNMILVYIKDQDRVRCMFQETLDKFCKGKLPLILPQSWRSTENVLENDFYIVVRGAIPKNAGEIRIMEDDIQPGHGGFQPGQPASSRRFRHRTPTQRLTAGVVFARIKLPKWVYWSRKICRIPFPEIVVVLPKSQGIRGRWMN